MPRKRITKLHDVLSRIRKVEAKDFKELIQEGTAAVLANLEQPYSGFAFVAWDNHGNSSASWHAGLGPIGPNMVPVFAQDVLSRSITQTSQEGEDEISGS